MIRLKKYLPFLSFWFINSLFLYLAVLVRPLNFELGNFWLSRCAATFWAGFWLTALVEAAKSLEIKLNFKLKGKAKIFAFFWLANSATIWIVARFAALTGFGISRYYWAIALGLVVNVGQWIVWQILESAKLVSER
ncbi:MAG: hypothetical protein WBD86_00410 [Microgenomates group bacterium]